MQGPLTANFASRDEVKSTAYVRLTSRYVDAGTARVSELALPPDDKPFSFDATPIPDMIVQADQIKGMLGGNVAQFPKPAAAAIPGVNPPAAPPPQAQAMPATMPGMPPGPASVAPRPTTFWRGCASACRSGSSFAWSRCCETRRNSGAGVMHMNSHSFAVQPATQCPRASAGGWRA